MSLLALHFIVSVPFPVSACGNGQSEASITCPFIKKVSIVLVIMDKSMIDSSKNKYILARQTFIFLLFYFNFNILSTYQVCLDDLDHVP